MKSPFTKRLVPLVASESRKYYFLSIPKQKCSLPDGSVKQYSPDRGWIVGSRSHLPSRFCQALKGRVFQCPSLLRAPKADIYVTRCWPRVSNFSSSIRRGSIFLGNSAHTSNASPSLRRMVDLAPGNLSITAVFQRLALRLIPSCSVS